MFTGIVEELGEVVDWVDLPDAARITVRGPRVTGDVAHGDSISVSGVCLTVVGSEGGTFTADVMKETLTRTCLQELGIGSPVNLERAVRLQDRLGGHLVQGHVDGATPVLEVHPQTHWTVLRVALPDELDRYVVRKGSVAVDGVSLTVSDLGPGWFEVSLVPATLAQTTLGRRAPGDLVNLEVDITGKYVEKLLAGGRGDR